MRFAIFTAIRIVLSLLGYKTTVCFAEIGCIIFSRLCFVFQKLWYRSFRFLGITNQKSLVFKLINSCTFATWRLYHDGRGMVTDLNKIHMASQYSGDEN